MYFIAYNIIIYNVRLTFCLPHMNVWFGYGPAKINVFFFSINQYMCFTSIKKCYFNLNNKLLEVDNKLKSRNLSMTQWTARAESIKNVVWILFEDILFILFKLINDTYIDNKIRAQALGFDNEWYHLILYYVFIYLMKHIMC